MAKSEIEADMGANSETAVEEADLEKNFDP
jgi:hypothetical protein